MKISLVTETFPPEINGVSMTLGRLVDGLSKRGLDVTVVAPYRKNRTVGVSQHFRLHATPGIPIPRYPELRFGLPSPDSLSDLWQRERPDVVHIATEGPLGWSASKVAEAMEIPVVSSFHTNFHSYGDHYGFAFIKKWVLSSMRSFHNRTLRTFVPSQDVIDELSDQEFHNLRLFARGVDTQLFGPHRRSETLRQSWKAGEKAPVAMYVGRLAAEKNISLVIEAWSRMRAHLPGLKLVLVGDGPEKGRLKKASPEILFAGMQQGEALAAHYASADIFLFASRTETFGNVVTEAMASAVPVLAYAYAAPGRFIQTGKNGWLAPYDDPKAFLETAEILSKHPGTWKATGQLARETLLPHSWDSIIDLYCEELETLPGLKP